MNTQLAFQIIALVLGANAIFFALVIWMLERDRRKLSGHVGVLDQHIQRTDSMVNSLVDWMISSDKISKVDEALLINVARSGVTDEYLQKMSLARLKLKREHQKHREELMLHCSNKEWRESAYKTLSNGLGDLESLSIMNRLASLDSTHDSESEYLRVVLKRRLVRIISMHSEN